MNASQSTAYGFGIATQNLSASTLECSFYQLGLGNPPTNNMDSNFKSLIGEDPIRKVKRVAIEVKSNLNDKPKDAADVYLRLHLLSHRLVKPNSINLDGIFSLLSNVVWTSAGACEVEGFEKVRPQLQSKFQNLTIYGVDKFPRMVDYVIPAGVRIADGDRVRLGAYLSAGTTVIHEGFVNFNAGTLGKSMVEGRISAGVVVGDGSEISLSALDVKNNESDNFSIKVGETSSNFKMIFNTENLKMVPGNYDVAISSKGISHFKHVTDQIEYWIATEAGSKYEG